jgi:hypothetical protein
MKTHKGQHQGRRTAQGKTRRKAKMPAAVKVVKVALPNNATVLEIVPAKAVVPVVSVHPETKAVYVVPAAVKPETWWTYLFGH